MNVQNIPRTQKDVKRAFVPKLDAFLFFDYKAIEVRLLAYYLIRGIGDESLRDEIVAGLDPHVETAKGIFGKSSVTDEERQIGKTLNFSIIYGGGTPTIMRQLRVTYQEAKELLRGYHKTRPGIATLRDTVDSVLQERGYLINSHGRRLRVTDSHKGLNALIQGSAADLMRSAILEVSDALSGYSSHIVNVIHDEIMIDASIDEVPFLISEIPDKMTDDTISAIMPIEVDCEWSTTNWAEKKEYDSVVYT